MQHVMLTWCLAACATSAVRIPTHSICLCLQVIDVRTWFFELCYQSEEGFQSGLPDAVQRSTTYCRQLSAYLGTKPWLLGDRITYVDIMAYDMLTNWQQLEPKVLDGSDNLRQLVARFEALPNIKKYMDSDRFIKPINAHMAVFGAAK